MFENQNVLVAGGAGFLGSNLIQRLLSEGVNVRATLHKNQPQIESDKVEWIWGDLTQKDACLAACEGIDVLIICAAQTAGAMVIEKTPLVHLTPNLIINAQLMEAAYEQGVKKVAFISSNTVYPVSDLPMRETDHTGEYFHKYHIVASMKYFSEQICEMYANRVDKPMDVVVIRPGNMYGPFDDFEWASSHVLPAFIRRVIERHDPIAVWGNGQDIKDFIYVEDVVDGVLAALVKTKGFEIFNIAGGQGYCLKDLLARLIEMQNLQEVTVSFDISKPTMIPLRLINIDKAKEMLNFYPETSIEEGLMKTIDWYEKRYDHHKNTF